MCSTMINLCILASAQTIPGRRPADKTIPGWNEQAKVYQERSLFWHWIWYWIWHWIWYWIWYWIWHWIWHWIWLEAGKPMNGYVYNIINRTRHQYHYAIRCAKRNNTEIIMTKLADNMFNSKDIWKELQKMEPASKSISNTVDQADKITDKFLTKYEELFNSVPTSDSEVEK